MTPSTQQERQVRDTYDKVAARYAEQFVDELRHKPLDRALLGAFSEQVAAISEQTGQRTAVADIGCGPGHVTAYLAELGLAARGIDLSPGMIEVARGRYPGLDFTVGQMPELPLADGELAGAVLFYSIIHLTQERRAAAFADLARVLRADGLMLVAFHIGDDERRQVDNWFGQRVSFDGYLLSVRTVTDEIAAAGLAVEAIVQRAPYRDVETSGTQRCYVLARKHIP